MHVIRHVLIRGRVQGVGFRAFVEYTALEQGLQGWVRNRRDGTVEAVFAGPQHAVDATIATCRTGPGSARVDHLDQRDARREELDPCRPGERFSMLPTA